MSFSFSDFKTGKAYKVEGTGLTEAQARQIFEQQLRSGSLVGLKPGMVLDAAQQAVGGLAGAAAQATQGLQQAAGAALNTAGTALKNITQKTFGTPGAPTNGIDVADFAKQAPALSSIAQLSQNAVRSVTAQASNLVGQASSVMTDTLGAGKFGFDASQLERAGMLKPGTAATYLAQGQNALTDVLKSPAVWTGKDGINSAQDLLSSVPTQDRIQQQLMQSGTSALGELGVPIDKLSPQALAGAAMNAAKSVTDALAWATGGGLSSAVSSAFDQAAKSGAFAVGFGDTKVSDAMKQQTPPEESVDTVERETVNAAATRVVGNEKVPEVSYTTPTPPVGLAALQEEINVIKERLKKADAARLLKAQEANAFYEQLDKEIQVLEGIDKIDSIELAIQGQLRDIKQRAKGLVPPSTALDPEIDRLIQKIDLDLDVLDLLRDKVKQIIQGLQARASSG